MQTLILILSCPLQQLRTASTNSSARRESGSPVSRRGRLRRQQVLLLWTPAVSYLSRRLKSRAMQRKASLMAPTRASRMRQSLCSQYSGVPRGGYGLTPCQIGARQMLWKLMDSDQRQGRSMVSRKRRVRRHRRSCNRNGGSIMLQRMTLLSKPALRRRRPSAGRTVQRAQRIEQLKLSGSCWNLQQMFSWAAPSDFVAAAASCISTLNIAQTCISSTAEPSRTVRRIMSEECEPQVAHLELSRGLQRRHALFRGLKQRCNTFVFQPWRREFTRPSVLTWDSSPQKCDAVSWSPDRHRELSR